MKKVVWLGATIGSLVGAWFGAVVFDHGNYMGGWSLMLAIVGAIPGGILAYKIVNNL